VIPNSLGVIVRAYKTSVTLRINYLRGFTQPPIWQRNYYERVIRDEKEYVAIVDYIDANPANWSSDRIRPPSSFVFKDMK
jgi:REP-associated tyrosine transposase